MTTTEQNAVKQKRFAHYLSTLTELQRENAFSQMEDPLREKMRRLVREITAKRVAGWGAAMKRSWLENLRRSNLREYQLTYPLIAAFEVIENRQKTGSK